METKSLDSLVVGMPIVYGGNKQLIVDESLAQRFKSGDSIVVVEDTGQPLIIPAEEKSRIESAVEKGLAAFYELSQLSNDTIDHFYQLFAQRLENDEIWSRIQKENKQDIARAQERSRSTTRLIANEKCRQTMVAGLRDQLEMETGRGKTVDSKDHNGWKVDLIQSEIGVVGFVFEGRPNVIADATGVLKSGNSVIFRIGQDALLTSKAIMDYALIPSLKEAGLPEHCVQLLDSRAHAAGWALFSHKRMALVVARGSGSAVRTLGSLAKQHGIPASLHGTGGAWMMIDETPPIEQVEGAIIGSLDRKVCNTLNVIALTEKAVPLILPSVLKALETAGSVLNQSYKLHVVKGSDHFVPNELFNRMIPILRSDGSHTEPQVDIIEKASLAEEWEWESTPEVSLIIVPDLVNATQLFNQYSPQFVLSVLTSDSHKRQSIFSQVNAPFLGNGMTRWVDGQYALNAPELGLSNWENGRFLGRSSILSGSHVYTVQIKMTQQDFTLRR